MWWDRQTQWVLPFEYNNQWYPTVIVTNRPSSRKVNRSVWVLPTGIFEFIADMFWSSWTHQGNSYRRKIFPIVIILQASFCFLQQCHWWPPLRDHPRTCLYRQPSVSIMLSIMSGARQGELLGLKWSEVDWENSQIHIQRTFNNGRWYDVKTKASKRRVDLGPQMMTTLKRWRLACPITALDLVFPNRVGKPINHNNLVNRPFFAGVRKSQDRQDSFSWFATH